MKKRTGDPWMPADEYGRSLKGVGINLLVASIEAARSFHTEVGGAEEGYRSEEHTCEPQSRRKL